MTDKQPHQRPHGHHHEHPASESDARALYEAYVRPSEAHLCPLRTVQLAALAADYEASARVGAARLGFRQRWAILSAAGIYGAIARKVAGGGPRVWDARVFTSRGEKIRWVLRAGIQALRRPGAAPRPHWSRLSLKAMAGEMGASRPGA